MLNVLRGGTLIGVIEKEIPNAVVHLKDASDPAYDSHRHPITVLPDTPVASWFAKSLVDTDVLHVNSYHHGSADTRERPEANGLCAGWSPRRLL